MKICIVSSVNIKHSSLLSLYTDFFKQNNLKFDIIYADKYDIDENINAETIYKYNLKIFKNTRKIIKLIEYIKFSLFARKVLNHNDYDVVIIWKTETALLLLSYLLKNKNKYILNIRDYFYESNFIIKKLVNKLVNNSLITTVSSPGFFKFLPQSNKYFFVNSLNLSQLNRGYKKNELNYKLPINITFIGYIRFIEEDIKMINSFANDNRFKLRYIGEGSEKLKDYIQNNHIENIELIGGFPIEDTSDYLKTSDIINNVYGNKRIALDTAISIRYYHSLFLNIPIMVSKGTYMEELVKKTQGFVVEDYSQLSDKVFNWYRNINMTKLSIDNEEKYADIIKQNNHFISILTRIFIEGDSD